MKTIKQLIHRNIIHTSSLLLIILFSSHLTAANTQNAKSHTAKQNAVLLITAEELAEAWQPFADWKTIQGKSTKIITVNQIDKTYSAKNIQEKIRLCVRDHIDNHQTRWVILGGDSLPGGKGLVPGGHTTVHREEPQGIPTDIVYLSPTNWDADGDGIYGEFKDDQSAITYPDGSVGLGRIPVRTAEDIAAFTDKVIAYESRYPTNNFAKQIIYTCTEKHAYPKVRKSWDSHLSKVWDGDSKRYFVDETPWDKKGQPGSYPLSPENMVKLFNKKTIGKLHIHGHGNLPVWVFEDHDDFSGKHVTKLKHEDAYPLITTVSCHTGEYDSQEDPSIVEHIIRQPKGGSVAVVAPVRTGKPHFAKESDFELMMTEGKLDGTTLTMTRYWTIGMQQNVTTGEALMKAKAQMAEDGKNAHQYHLCISEINLLGDPTLDMRNQNPRAPKLTLPKKIKTGKQKISIKTNAPGSTVCLWKKGDIYQVAQANSQGKAEFTIDPKNSGEMSVSVSGVNLNSVVKKIQIK